MDISQIVNAAVQDSQNESDPQPIETQSETPWHAAFPRSSHEPQVFPQRRALTLLKLKIASILIIDVRRTDYTGGSIRGSLNVPAQGFYWNRGILYELAYKADMEWVVFTCGSSKEGGRAWKCASWFLDHVRDTVGDKDMSIGVLEGGVKGWVRGGGELWGYMDGFRMEEWEGVLAENEEEKPVEALSTQQPSTGAASMPTTTDGNVEPKEKIWSFESMMGD